MPVSVRFDGLLVVMIAGLMLFAIARFFVAHMP